MSSRDTRGPQLVRRYRLLQAQRKPVRIAAHLHVPAQVIRAAQCHIPTLALLRKPKDAVISLALRDPMISFRHALRYYIAFY
ncbi:MAG: hypothetical protein M3294_03480, partial [Pseudomonadota bacterium]|nr:hypothetical protein [Pseudomonadota bacterium]